MGAPGGPDPLTPAHCCIQACSSLAAFQDRLLRPFDQPLSLPPPSPALGPAGGDSGGLRGATAASSESTLSRDSTFHPAASQGHSVSSHPPPRGVGHFTWPLRPAVQWLPRLRYRSTVAARWHWGTEYMQWKNSPIPLSRRLFCAVSHCNVQKGQDQGRARFDMKTGL